MDSKVISKLLDEGSHRGSQATGTYGAPSVLVNTFFSLMSNIKKKRKESPKAVTALYILYLENGERTGHFIDWIKNKMIQTFCFSCRPSYLFVHI